MLWWRLGGRRIRLLLWSVTWVDLYCRLKCFECLVHDCSEGKAMGQMWVKVFVYLLCTRHWQMQNQLDEWHFLPKVMPRLSLLKEFRKACERGSDKWEVQMQCEEPVRVEGPPALHPHLPKWKVFGSEPQEMKEMNCPHRILRPILRNKDCKVS